MTRQLTLLSANAGGADPYAGLPAAELLREVGEIVGVRMAQLLPQALERAAGSLYRQAEQAIDMEKRLLNMEAGQLAQHRLVHLPADFRRHFERRFPAACRRDPLRRHGLMDSVDPTQLRIVDETRLEAALDVTDLTRALEDGCQQSLYGLLHQFRQLLQDPDLPPAQLPLGPRVLGQALAQALGEHPSARAPKLKVLQALALHLPALLQPLYRDIHSYIDQHHSPAEATAIVLDTLPELPEPTLPGGCTGNTDTTTGAAAPPDPRQSSDAAAATMDPSLQCAREEVAARLAGQPLPEAVQDFLQRYWQSWLADCHRRHGAESDAWQMALATMDEVILALTPQPVLSAQARLRRLPAVLGRLRAGMAAVGIPAEARDRFLVQWMQAQAQLLEAGSSSLQAAGQAEPALRSAPDMSSPDARRAAPGVSCNPSGVGLGAAEPRGVTSTLNQAVRTR